MKGSKLALAAIPIQQRQQTSISVLPGVVLGADAKK